ncbi:MAG: hypothetical protein ACYDEF_17210, partial [Methanosarcina sp.]
IFFDLCFVLTIEFEQNYPNIYSSFIILEIGLYNHCLRVGEVLLDYNIVFGYVNHIKLSKKLNKSVFEKNIKRDIHINICK